MKHEERARKWLDAGHLHEVDVAELAAEFAAVEEEARREAFEEAADEVMGYTEEHLSGKRPTISPGMEMDAILAAAAGHLRNQALKSKAEEKHGD